jgi:ankyrin repeat protein
MHAVADNAQGKDGENPFTVANGNLNPERIAMLVKEGADLEAQDNDGWTPMRRAAAYNQNPEVITMLLKAGAALEARDNNGMTALMYAAWENPNPEVIATLLNAGADVKAKSNSGKTPLDYAQDNENLKSTDAYRQLEKASQ